MARSKKQKVAFLYSSPRLLTSESSEEFASLREQLNHAVKPRNIIEEMYLDDTIAITWEIRRTRHWIIDILNAARLPALQGLLEQLLCAEDFEFPYLKDRGAEELARGYFGADETVKATVDELLAKIELGESAIEAEAYRLRADEFERLDRMLTVAEVRREKLFRFIAEYRQGLAKAIERASDEVLENDQVMRLVTVVRSN